MRKDSFRRRISLSTTAIKLDIGPVPFNIVSKENIAAFNITSPNAILRMLSDRNIALLFSFSLFFLLIIFKQHQSKPINRQKILLPFFQFYIDGNEFEVDASIADKVKELIAKPCITDYPKTLTDTQVDTY
mgnify:CR=1 FL=1